MVVVANARLPASLLARPAAVLQTRSAKAQRKASNCKMPPNWRHFLWRNKMIHQYKLNGFNIVLDVCSGSVHVVDEIAYDIIAEFENKEKE